MALLPYLSKVIEFKFNSNILNCEFFFVRSPHLALIKLIMFFGIPLVLVIYVFRTDAAQANKISFNSLGDKNAKRKGLFRQNWKAEKIVFVVVGMFFYFVVPLFYREFYQSIFASYSSILDRERSTVLCICQFLLQLGCL